MLRTMMRLFVCIIYFLIWYHILTDIKMNLDVPIIIIQINSMSVGPKGPGKYSILKSYAEYGV